MLSQSLGTWLDIGGLNVPIEPCSITLSAVMCLVITGIGFLIHVYSIGYMHSDPGYARFFAYLNGFVLAMCTLVLGANLPMVFVGWEGVGLCSFLLIGFWFGDAKNAAAATKAFLVNRIGDLGFMTGLLVLFWATLALGSPTVSFAELKVLAPRLSQVALFGVAVPVLATIALFVAATGKSAQIPLFVWLPDAMAGPTPVSALIHAATMVTAGIYLLCRTSFLYVLAPGVCEVVSIVAAVTACFAATVALFQHDIKKALAYSTVSQLGYMFLGCGVGAFAAGLFHVVTHAFFKALLFLGAGSVIHALDGEQDLRHMGGLRRELPVTSATFAVGVLSLAGFPLLAGFFSKDGILWRVVSGGDRVLYAIALVTSALTAFYSMRVFVLAFAGAFRGDAAHAAHVHESPKTMTIPLAVLAIGCVLVGWLAAPTWMGTTDRFAAWLEPVLPLAGHGEGEHGGAHAQTRAELLATLVAVVVGLGGIGVSWMVFGQRPKLARAWAARFPRAHAYLSGPYRRVFDDLYGIVVVRPLLRLTRALSVFDKRVVDGIVHGSAALVRRGSAASGWLDRFVIDRFFGGLASIARSFGIAVAATQSGRIQTYLVVLAWALAAWILFWEVVR
ncbi:MAG: NADH-quinone oxidoreductase subunit L [bacterium]